MKMIQRKAIRNLMQWRKRRNDCLISMRSIRHRRSSKSYICINEHNKRKELTNDCLLFWAQRWKFNEQIKPNTKLQTQFACKRHRLASSCSSYHNALLALNWPKFAYNLVAIIVSQFLAILINLLFTKGGTNETNTNYWKSKTNSHSLENSTRLHSNTRL